MKGKSIWNLLSYLFNIKFVNYNAINKIYFFFNLKIFIFLVKIFFVLTFTKFISYKFFSFIY